MDISKLHEVTTVYRKGEEVIKKGNVTEIYGYPHVDVAAPEAVLIDCHFVVIEVDKQKAEAYWPNLVAALLRYSDLDRLAGGPSYIEFAPALGIEQEDAFRVFTVGEALDKWQIITPETFGFSGAEADSMAGSGMVMMSGFRTQEAS